MAPKLGDRPIVMMEQGGMIDGMTRNAVSFLLQIRILWRNS